MKIKNGFKVLVGIVILFFLFSFSDKKETSVVNIKSIIQYIEKLSVVPTEKIYLHLDKSYYSAGENLWFKGYLVNGRTYLKDTLSNFIYVELYNKQDSLITRKKIKRKDGEFYGCLELKNTLLEGDYYVRSYTTWMQNFDKDYFFYKNIYVINPVDEKLSSKINFLKEKGKLTSAKIDFFIDRKPFSNKILNCNIIVDDKLISRQKHKTSTNGGLVLSLKKLPDHYKKAFISVKLEDKIYEYENIFSIPYISRDFGVSFFPEGGALLQNTLQKVAFKIEKYDGIPVYASGVVINNEKDTIAEFKTSHDGMGMFILYTELQNSYKAIITTKEGKSKTFDLPEVKATGINVGVETRGNILYYKFYHTPNFALTDSLYLIVLCKDIPVKYDYIKDPNQIGKINLNNLPEGIVHFMLVAGHSKTPLSERLFFVKHSHNQKWIVTANKTKYEKRDKAEIDLKLTDISGNPYTGNFSVSITDKSLVTPDSLSDNIRSSLLLTSDLKGYIHNPGYYFNGDDNIRNKNLDLLMMTQGWRKYTNYEFDKTLNFDFKYCIERGQAITGKVKNILGGKIKKGSIVALAPKKKIFAVAETDDQGTFAINGLCYKDTVDFVIQARSKGGFSHVELIPDLPEYPECYNRNIYIPFVEDNTIDRFKETAKDKYFAEGNLFVHNLKEIKVTANKLDEDSNTSIYSAFTDESVSGDALTNYGASNALEVLEQMNGVIANDNEISIRGQGTPLLIIDDLHYEDEDIVSLLEQLSVDNIKSISIKKDASTSLFGTSGVNGVILITTKRGFTQIAEPPLGLVNLKLIGFSESPEFYHPIYETQIQKNSEKKDIRSTLYWNPKLKIDSLGIMKIVFYTADKSPKLHIDVEGLSKDGIICRYSKDL